MKFKALRYNPIRLICNNGPLGIGIVVIAVLLCAAIIVAYQKSVSEYKHEFALNQKNQAEKNAESIAFSLTMLYQGLRTIARLPGTRKIDLASGHIDPSTLETIQEIYNNLYTNIRLSEVYLLPKGFNPDLPDPRNGRPMLPITTFDEFIVGRAVPHHTNSSEASNVPEIEIYEYRLMREQFQWFRQHYPNEQSISDLSYPALSGKEVITCDNSMLIPSDINDKDRSGIVYSVPFYGSDDQLKGMVSGVVLSNVLRGFIANRHYSLVNTKTDYHLSLNSPYRNNAVNPTQNHNLTDNIIFSLILPLDIIDHSGEWQLRVAVPDNEFWSLPQVESALSQTMLSVVTVLVITLAILTMIGSFRQQRYAVQRANQAKTDFLSRMSHELRTPLNAIIGYSELILESAQDPCQLTLKNDAKKIRQSGMHLLELINDILDLSKIESGRIKLSFEAVNISQLLNDVASTIYPVLEKNGNTLSEKIADDIGEITSDPVRLKQILLNLLSNAAKFTRNGTIDISVEQCREKSGDKIVFIVSDSGIGMTEKQIKRIFEDFVQADDTIARNYGGTGLGLAITRRLCNLLGGEIDVTSSPGKGSTFTVRLPVEPMHSPGPAPHDSALPSSDI